jgi:group I intron endonuclease
MKTIIYGITHPEYPKVIRYVGKTKKTISQRINQHIYLSKKKLRRPINLWINKLLGEGLKPEIIEIEVVEGDDWQNREIFWIKYYREKFELLNLSDGGGSNLNYSPSPETRKKISEGNKGKVGYWKGKKMTDEHKQKISDGGYGKTRNNETKENISKSLKDRKLSEQHKSNLSISKKGKDSKNKKPVVKICLKTGKEIETYDSLEDARVKNNIKSKGNIVSVCKNERKKCGGFNWKYKVIE